MKYRSRNIRKHVRRTLTHENFHLKYYLLQNERRNYILEEKLLIALIKANADIEIVQKLKDVEDQGWWIGNDGEAYEKFSLSTKMQSHYFLSSNYDQYENYSNLLILVTERNTKIQDNDYLQQFKKFCAKNGLYNIEQYQGKEMVHNLESDNRLEQK